MQKKRICIVTNYSNTTNYGALLQAYALNRVINEMGYIAEDLYYVKDGKNKWYKLVGQIKNREFKSIFNQTKSRVERIRVKRRLDERKLIMDKFRFSIPHTRKCNDASLDKLSDEFDVFICGSDQIFRPNKNSGKLEPHYWLAMVDNSRIKASYAASIGVDRFDNDNELRAVEYLKSFDYISLREASAANYIKMITGRDDVITSIDPVFLLDQNEWLRIASPYEIEGEYILVYMIHGTESLYKSIEEFAKLKNLKIVTFPSMSYKYKSFEKNFGDVEISDATPNQFIYLIYNAAYFFTDSFHGTAFSVILQKNAFISRANELAFSRINNLVTITGTDKLVIPAEGLSAKDYLRSEKNDWEYSDKKIMDEREKSIRYLKTIIES